jgi:hypothetical protein
MKDSILLGITIFLLLCAVPWLRIYFRTGLNGALLTGVGEIVFAFGFLGVAYWFMRDIAPWESPSSLPFFVLLIAGLLILIISRPVLYIKESGLWKHIYDKTPYAKRVIGSVPIVKYERLPGPSINKRTSLSVGISLMAMGILIIMVFILFKVSINYILIASISAFILGLVVVIFSIVYLHEAKR